ncbi:MAG: hypothetical protein ACFFBP_20005 [Promethearchaeota archaeon]
MKHKKLVLIVILLCFLGQLNIIKYCTAFPCNILYLNSDKDVYYLDDEILINASWELNYNPDIQISYIKIQIFNSFNNNLWESLDYDNMGISEENWTVIIKNLNLSFSTSSCFISIKFYLYFYNTITQQLITDYIETIPIQILKRDLSCRLIGFNNHLHNEEALNFYAKFFYQSSENYSYLVNQTIFFEIMKDKKILYSANYTTNIEGVIHISIPNISKITTGQIKIRFLLQNDSFLNDCILDYDLFIDDIENEGISNDILMILLTSVIIVGSLISTLIYRNFKRTRKKSLAELTIEI